MYNNSSTQYPNSGYPASYQHYSTNYGSSGYGYQGYEQYAANQQQQTQQSTTGQWTTASYGSTQKDAVAQEMQQQKAQLIKQREDYVRKVTVLRRELEQLRVQKQELVGDGHHGSNILRENDKLQEEIQGKMKAIQNVIEMLSSIIKDGQSISDLETTLASNDSEKQKMQTSHQDTTYKQTKKEITTEPKDYGRYNYVHYDTGMHWCRLCDDFPETAKDYLLHLQDKGHRQVAKENDVDNTPWHKLPSEPVLPSDEDAPTKRVPIKGLQFFISAPSWYCKLCDVWIGDLHCASHHLKSQAHFQNYENFVVQNPHWEMEWLKDRETALSRKTQNSSDSDEPEKKKRRRKDKKHSHELLSGKDKKRKKRSKKHRKQSSDSSSSSSSSDSSSEDEKSDRSKSIRVAMRNMKQVQSIIDEDLSGKWNVLEKLVEEHKKKQETEKQEKEKELKQPEDALINQWMTVSSTHDKDRQLLESLKDRMRQKQELERVKQAEFDKKKREKERADLERSQLKLKQEKEAAEEAERERKRKEQEEYERIRDKERNQVRFKANTNYRRRRSDSRSDDEDDPKNRYREERNSKESHGNNRSRSRSVERKMDESNEAKKKPPGPPSYKKLPFIGRMPLFKNKKTVAEEREEKKKEIQKESYDQPRRTRFEPGNLPRAFIPRPDVVCFPKLSSIPPLTIPPPPTVTEKVEPPEPPTISKTKTETQVINEEPEAPPPPKLNRTDDKQMNLSDDEVLYANPGEGMDPSMMGQYYQDYQNMMYSSQDMYSYQDNSNENETSIPHSHTMPLQPPPLPPDDDLALLGICADDMAAQSF